jgi:hypothetical protein
MITLGLDPHPGSHTVFAGVLAHFLIARLRFCRPCGERHRRFNSAMYLPRDSSRERFTGKGYHLSAFAHLNPARVIQVAEFSAAR